MILSEKESLDSIKNCSFQNYYFIIERVILIKPVSKSFVYDGNDHYLTNEDFEYVDVSNVSITNNILENHTVMIEFSNGISSTYFSSKSISIKNIHIYENNIDVTHNYKIYTNYEDLYNDYYNKDDFYEKNINKYKTKFNATLKITKREIEIKTSSAEKIYDGQPLYCNEYELLNENLLQGHKFEIIENSCYIIDSGSKNNQIKFKVIDSNGNDVSKYYKGVYTYGKLTVKKVDITLKTADGEWFYDGTEHYAHEIELTDGSLLEGHYIDYENIIYISKVTYVSRIDNEAKTSSIKIYDSNNKDVTKNYNIKVVYGKLTVKRNY